MTNHLSIIKEKLYLAGFGNPIINGFIIGVKKYKVRLKDQSIITMEKDGRMIHIFENRCK